jgi:hypothetical protein
VNSDGKRALKATKHLENHTETAIGQRYFKVLSAIIKKK